MTQRRKYIVGNWKMNGTSAALDEIAAIAKAASQHGGVDAALCVPATLIERAARTAGALPVGGQDCHSEASGAHTGCISAEMLVDAGATLTIVGHSERREAQGETDDDVRGKAEAALAAKLGVIVCVGESEAQRDAGDALTVVTGQVKASCPGSIDGGALAVAYEPIWAIGTGRVPETSDVAEMHDAIRQTLESLYGDAAAKVRILYGGSMNGGNASELLAASNVDGGLVGGASLTAAKFVPIIQAAAAL